MRFLVIFLIITAFGVTADTIRPIASTETEYTFEFDPGDWLTTPVQSDPSMVTVTFDGAEMIGDIGEPQLPTRVITLGVPWESSVSVQVLDSKFQQIDNITLAPKPQLVKQDIGYMETYERGSDLYTTAVYFPQNLVELSSVHEFRGYRTAKIAITPLQYNPVERTLRQYSHVTVRVTYAGGRRSTTPRSLGEPDEVLKTLMLNWRQARSWVKPSPALKKGKIPVFQGDDWVKINIESSGSGGKEGIYKLTGATLNQLLSANNRSISDIDPTTLQLFNNGGRELSREVIAAEDTLRENPIIVADGNDGSFDQNDYILFYGKSVEGVTFNNETNSLKHYIHPYTYSNVYWLTFNRSPGKRIAQRPSLDGSGLTPESTFRDLAWLEEEKFNIYNSGIIWLGRELNLVDNTYSVNFDLSGAVPQNNAIFRFGLASLTSGRHYFTMYANGNSLGQFDQSGGSISYYMNTAVFQSSGVLMDGDNTITINYNVSSQTAFSYVDFIEVEYHRRFLARDNQLVFHSPLKSTPARYRLEGFSGEARVFDVTDPGNIVEMTPNAITGSSLDFSDDCSFSAAKRYIGVADAAWREIKSEDMDYESITGLRGNDDVDYIIITHDDFYQQALQLESLRENWSPKDRLETRVVNYSDVINEFGFGIEDPAAIRNFLAFAQDHWNAPGYVVLIGDGHFDYKNILRNNVPNLIIPFETDGQNENLTRVTDDWYTYTRGEDSGMQMAIGRLIVQTVDEAQNVINKIIKYETDPEFGEWLKTVTIVADDEYTNNNSSEILHTHQAERLAEQYVPDLLDVHKIYLINYPAVKTASITGREKPAASMDLMERINRGSLIINYIGHGNDELWAHEKVLDNARDFDKFDNGSRMAMWVAATCEFAHWDQPAEQSFAEKILAVANRGAVSMVSSARLAYANDNAAFNYDLYRHLFQDYSSTGLTARVGDAIVSAKQNRANRENNEKYALFGDPAMRLCAPRYRAVIDQVAPDSIQALSTMSITGHVEENQELLSQYSGKVLVRVMDTRKSYQYKSPDGITSNTLYRAGNNIFRGIASIEDGEFAVNLIVPKDISYGGEDGRISLYFWNDNSSGSGVKSGIPIGATGVDLVDHEGPAMHLYFENENFVPGDYVSTRPKMHLEIGDSLSGVNTAGDVGHQILLTINEDYANSTDITEYFTYNEGSYTEGKLDYTIYDLPLGEHSVQVKAWDNSNNSSIAETYFVVLDDSELAIRNPLTYPNPMYEHCTFHYELSRDAQVAIKIYTVAGRLIKSFHTHPGQVGYNTFADVWDGRDEHGDRVANGVYLYKITAQSARGEESVRAEVVEKLIITR